MKCYKLKIWKELTAKQISKSAHNWIDAYNLIAHVSNNDITRNMNQVNSDSVTFLK